METADIPTTHESSHVEIKMNNVHLLLDIKGTVHFEFILQSQTVKKLIKLKYRSGYVKLCVKNGLNFGPTIGFSNMTQVHFTRRSPSSSFWPKNWLLKWNTYLIPQFGYE
jgi:hypothetical protein